MHTCILKWKLSFLIQVRKHLCKKIWESEVIYKSYNYMPENELIVCDVIQKNPKPPNLCLLVSQALALCWSYCCSWKTQTQMPWRQNIFKSPGKLKGPTMECFKGKIEMSITIRKPLPKNKVIMISLPLLWSVPGQGCSYNTQENLATPKTKHPVNQQILRTQTVIKFCL